MFGPFSVMQYEVSFIIYVFNHLAEEERVGCLTLMFLLDFL